MTPQDWQRPWYQIRTVRDVLSGRCAGGDSGPELGRGRLQPRLLCSRGRVMVWATGLDSDSESPIADSEIST